MSVVGGLILAFFLSIYAAKGYTVPIGWDASEYVGRTRLAQEVGLSNIDGPLPSITQPKAGRPAYPVIGATLSSALGAGPFRVTMVMASVLAVLIGLAAGAFFSALLRRPLWELGVVAVVVALSPGVIALMKPEGYLDTMLAGAVVMAASIPIALAVEDRAALVPAIALLGAGAAIHWSFFVLMAATVVLVGAAHVPTSWRRWRAGEPAWDTPTLRMGQVLGGAAILGTGLLFGVLGDGLPRTRADVSEFAKKLRRDLPKYRFPVTLPLAGLGAASLAREERSGGADPGRSRFVLAFLLSWCAVVLAGYLARTAFDLPVAAHRFLSFALAVPLLGVLGVLWLARLARHASRALGAAVVAAGLLGAGYLGYQEWFHSTKPFVDPSQLRQAALVGSYLDAVGVPPDRPFVVVVGSRDWNTVGLMGHIVRAGLPPERVPHMYLYVGTGDAFLARRPIDTPVSRAYFRRVEPVYEAEPGAPAVILSSFNLANYSAWLDGHPGTDGPGGIAVVRGPPAPAALRAPQPAVGPIAWWQLGLLGVASTLALALVGLGWTVAMLRRWLRPAEILAAAPAVGVAALVVAGILADRGGVRLTGLPGAMTLVGAAAAGWAVAYLTGRARSGAPAR